MPGYRAPAESAIDHIIELKSARSILICMPFNFEEFQDALSPLNSILESFAKRDITVITPWSYRNWLENVNNHRIITISDDNLNFLKLPRKSLIRQLKQKNFEVAIDLNPGVTLFSSILCAATGAKVRVGFAGEDSDRFFNFQVKLSEAEAANQQYSTLLHYIT